jgi:hypothetical protein
MASTLYKEYLVSSTATLDQQNGRWRLFASIIDEIGNETVRSLIQPARFNSKEEAEKFGIENCCRWIEENL